MSANSRTPANAPAARASSTSAVRRASLTENAALTIAAIPKNPAAGGIPASARTPIANAPAVQGIRRPSPPYFAMSDSSPVARRTEPAPSTRMVFRKAWAISWNRAAKSAPSPAATNMSPTCEIVDHARTRRTSRCAIATMAAPSAVTAPMSAAAWSTSGASTDRSRMSSTTPPATPTVCSSAETGVVASVASGNHT